MASEPFYLSNGKSIKDLKELLDELPEMDDNVFLHHVNEQKNDFAEWIKGSLNYRFLGKKIQNIKNKDDMLKKLNLFEKSGKEADKIKNFLEEKNKKARNSRQKFSEKESNPDEKKLSFNQQLLKTLKKEKQAIFQHKMRLEKSMDSSDEKIKLIKEKEKKLKDLELWIKPKEMELKDKEKNLNSLQKYLAKKEKDLEELEKSLKEKKKHAEKLLENRIKKKKKEIDVLNEEKDLAKARISDLIEREKNLKKSLKEKEKLPLDPLRGKNVVSIHDPYKIKDIEKLINAIKKKIKKKKFEAAKDLYHELTFMYQNLDEDEKHFVYPKILDVFKKLS